MSKVIAKLVDGKEIEKDTPFNIGDFVKVTDSWHQYSAYRDAFNYFWGNNKAYYLPYEGKDTPKIWKIINMALHPSNGKILYHIRTIDGKNAVVNGSALKKIEYHKRNRKNIHPIMIYQLCINPMPHSWKEKLYKVLDMDNVS